MKNYSSRLNKPSNSEGLGVPVKKYNAFTSKFPLLLVSITELEESFMIKSVDKKIFSVTRSRRPVTGLLIILGLAGATLSFPSQAIELGPEKTFFDSAPRLVRTSASQNSRRSPSTYYFTIEVPSEAGEALEAVTISQKSNLEEIDFNLGNSYAFRGGGLSGQPISLSQIGSSQPRENEVTLVFDQPVLPGNTVTIAVDVDQNPLYGGVYQFGVTAFSQGRLSPGLYLGTGRIGFTGH
jgi:hypothetical protein